MNDVVNGEALAHASRLADACRSRWPGPELFRGNISLQNFGNFKNWSISFFIDRLLSKSEMVLSIASLSASNVIKRQLMSSPVWRSSTDSLVQPLRFLHATSAGQYPRKRQFFSSNAALQAEAALISPNAPENSSQVQKRKAVRSAAGNRSLRRVAVEAQKSREKTFQDQNDAAESLVSGNGITAVCVAEEYDMSEVVRILRSHGFEIDPDGTGFLGEQVVHTRGVNDGDIFVFPSGILVTWTLPEDVAVSLATQTLKPATVNPHFPELEDLEYKEDATRDTSSIRGDVITLGVKSHGKDENSKVDTTLAKIAFSSGLARSTKLAVLESMLSKYFSSTRSIPTLLAKGARIPFDGRFILKKTGELLELRAQLNHYSELTDSLPDLFWDSRHELGLEGYYDQVGKALDVGVRIKTLNDKMDYAQESASVMRETLSQKHSSNLEIIIIVLISVEVAFGIRAIWKDVKGESKAAAH